MVFGRELDKGYKDSWRGIWLRREYDDLKDAIEKSHKLFGEIPNAKFYASATDLMWEFQGGEQLMFRAAKRHEDIDKWQGWELPFQAHEEATQWPDDFILVNMMACNRASGAPPEMPRIVRLSCNSMGRGHNWVKARYRLPQMNGKVLRGLVDSHGEPLPDRVAIELPRRDNLVLMRDDPKYESRLRAAAEGDPNKYRSWVLGGPAAWDIVSGGRFDALWIPNRDYIVVKPFEIPKNWRINRSFDWGSAKPFSVGWWAESDGSDARMSDGRMRSTVRGDLFRIHEYYGWTGKPNEGLGMLASEIAKNIVKHELARCIHGRVMPGPADTSIYTSEPGKKSIATDMAEPVTIDGKVYPGVKWTKADKADRVQGWEQICKRLAATRPPDNGAREKPGLFIFTECEQFLRTFPVLQRCEKDPDDVDSEMEDHIADETRYRAREKVAPASKPRTTGIY